MTDAHEPVLNALVNRLHTLETENAALRAAVRDVRAYADDRYDVDCTGDPPRYIANAWGEVLTMCDEALGLLRP